MVKALRCSCKVFSRLGFFCVQARLQVGSELGLKLASQCFALLRNGNDKGLSGVKVGQVLPAVKASEVALDDSCCIVSDSLCASSAAFINDSSRTMPSQVAAK